uniref:Uncharacterized protein n=1 Tax=Candidatus Kentrum eta TaxID=2126337 RepID=A0A450USM7_9GAMM|nr:MAG: hypothetical protein BECKH772A_GA0070896_1000136 [Candidatus Kentron sp. H]VFJ88247.1 MAG: hypothetical protein BECKH772B_GA0070898_1000128 [Candidatus Kentron sp. H]VFJ95466.1 MAG: hypothetical protein BECKH772C_GA0070978_1000236 [Candidatus Kentron sp. H]
MNIDMDTDMNIDAVAMMRRIRDDLSRKIEGMTWEEKNEFFKKSITSFGFITDRKNGGQACADSADFASLPGNAHPEMRKALPFDSGDKVEIMIPKQEPATPPRKQRAVGEYAGRIRMADDFTAPLPDGFWTGES